MNISCVKWIFLLEDAGDAAAIWSTADENMKIQDGEMKVFYSDSVSVMWLKNSEQWHF